ncbi:coiled-coil domain-containing protein 177 [Austrofundulus limnaeus]|uniref:Coiled-coil domain-containing protein 177 n=1 Tax=Austrofundulus limnaeus TaxID=52670 RepID=A0A2I4B139_AUSLI|nr:PREDICTED: coiled-coil domain-containing protein 177-like [Austrofundulus limnaeus]
MGELGSSPPVFCLDHKNSESAGTDRIRSTSRVLQESCPPPLGIKPVQLLIKSLNDLIAERRNVTCEAMRVMHESYEKERSKALQKCPGREQGGIIQASGSRWPRGNVAANMEASTETKVKEPTSDSRTPEPNPYADLCFRGKPACRSRCSAEKRDPERSTTCSLTLGDLRCSPAAEATLQRLTEEIRRKTCVTVSERDRKIAALVLVKHEEEQERLRLSQQEEQKQQEVRRQEEAQQAQAEKERRRKLRQSMRLWHVELEARSRMRLLQEEEKAGQLEQEALLQEDRWRRLKEEVEAQRREKLEGARKEAEERKRYQEKLLREKEEMEKREQERRRRAAAEMEEKACRSKLLREKREQRRLQEENRRELLRHILLRKHLEQRTEEEEAQTRSTLEEKLRRSAEKRAQAVEAQLQELQERSAREQEQLRRARLRAELQSAQQLAHKHLLVQTSQLRTQRASLNASSLLRSRAQQTREHNQHRQVCHRRLQEEMQREEEATTKARENYVSAKERRRERLLRQREQLQEEAQRLTRASFYMMDGVRQQTRSRTFDQMALEARLTTSVRRMKL